ncbi:inositol monophosphatase 1 [Frankliniella occidentalis]|uniref:Inositol-1-monophosphatase n=1 Tax=Frankliniella occidentalis TaxID=133901 RepID=A0A6J1T442_FRAOC|nr:inositol monophosphatase 1 [Frankliniella occidentalis]
MSVDLDKCFEVVMELAKAGGKIIRERIYNKKTVNTKSDRIDLVTETDQEVEKMLISNLQAQFPDHRFIGEESTAEGIPCELTDAPTWIIDPIDGTMNFVHGYPNVCTSIGFTVNKITEIAIIYNPVLEQMFTARRGQGAKLNGEPIHVSGEKELKQALLGLECGTTHEAEKMSNNFKNQQTFTPIVHGTRSSGSAAIDMAMVAMGGSDAYFEFGIHAWDYAAGDLLVREAGGVCLDPEGGPLDLLARRMLCAASMELAQEMIPKISQIYPPRD